MHTTITRLASLARRLHLEVKVEYRADADGWLLTSEHGAAFVRSFEEGRDVFAQWRPRPICGRGNLRPRRRYTRVRKDGTRGFHPFCAHCQRELNPQQEQGSRHRLDWIGRQNQRRKEELGLTCSRCGFIPEHPAQVDLDHIDGDGRNYARENLRVLCANCHRLKTVRAGDFHPREQRGLDRVTMTLDPEGV